MRLAPPGFTGPPTSNDQSNGNDDRTSTSLPFELSTRDPLRTRGLENDPGWQQPSRKGSRRRWSCNRLESVRDGPEIGNATAFNVSHGYVTRRALPNHDHGARDRSASRGSRPRSSHGKKARTRWKRDTELVDRSRIPIANATNVTAVAAFAYTAYNDAENADGDTDVSRTTASPPHRRGPRDKDNSRGEPIRRDTELRGRSRRGTRAGTTNRDYTARFQEPIANRGRRPELRATSGPTRLSNSHGRKYGLLFVLYLLAWPLVSSTNPSGQFATGFAQSPSLGPLETLPRRNVTQITPQQQQQQQQQHGRDFGDDDGHRRRARHEEKQQQDQRETELEESLSYQDQQAFIDTETTHPYNEYSWEVNQVNPWLSACDLAGPAPADLQGSCGPPEVPKNCPSPCAVTAGGKGTDVFQQVIEKVEVTEGRPWSVDENGKRFNVGTKTGHARGMPEGVRTAPEQCLFYLEESHKRDICRDDFGRSSTRSFLTPRENRYWFMSGLRLRHCCEHAVVNALAPGKGGPLENVLNGGQKCADALDKLLLVDALAARLHCEFEEVLARYDCAQPYSVIFNCTHCKEAYRKWVCSSLVPYFAHGGPQDLDTLENSWVGSRLRPCRSFCQSVEQRCPYLLPGDRAPAYPTQYAGEPTFLCRDPNIPETGGQASRALHSSEEGECCFHVCSEEKPGSGICWNCTDREPRKRGRSHDPPTAPHCEINPIQPASTGMQYPQSTSTTSGEDGEEEDSSMSPLSPSNTLQQQQGTSLCGSGGVGSMPMVSSSNRPSPSILLRLLWLCSLLASFLATVRKVPVLWITWVFHGLIAALVDRQSRGTGRALGLVASLRRRRGCCHVGARHCAKWMLEKWVMVERRCRGWWCWCWWWWRWRRRKSRAAPMSRRKRRRHSLDGVSCRLSTASRGDGGANRARRPCDECRGCTSTLIGRWTRDLGVKCRWWWWWWCWWWLCRRWRLRGRSIVGPRFVEEDQTGDRRRASLRGSERGDEGPDGDVWRSAARRRCLASSLRKDPP
ncbi:uncharacterized protein LOC128896117 [Hylaeus anthracinus]|uniref:uncharacterized protein LOC128896117 n=1 Tax=Hylaeus anthracinus TaxID=313031 RepID=UPI0023B93F93|nr:uncharacterized protein LOC128896117 [Hylaeus anthracinus]